MTTPEVLPPGTLVRVDGTAIREYGDRLTHEDGWSNVLTGIGAGQLDKRMGAVVTRRRPLTDQELETLFHDEDLIRTVCEKPAKEMTRQWIELRTPGASGEADPALAKKCMQWMETRGVRRKFREAITWGRLYGGVVILLGLDDGRLMNEPLNEAGIRSLKYITVLDRYKVQVYRLYEDALSDKYGEPELYVVHNSTLFNASGSSYVSTVHESRVLRFDGVLTSEHRRRENGGWSDGIVDAMLDVIRDFIAAHAGAANLLSDFSQAVYKIKGLAAMIASNKDGSVLKRVQIMNLTRSMARMVLLDEGEEFERKSTPVTGLTDLLDQVGMRLCSCADMPMTVLLGRSPAGMNATGESDLTLWREGIAAKQNDDVREPLERFIHLMMLTKDGPTKGVEPEDWSFEFRPLQEQSAKEVAETRKIIADTDKLYLDGGVLDADEIRANRFTGEKFSGETVIEDEDVPETDPLPDDPPKGEPGADPAKPVPKGGGAAADPTTAYNGAQVSSLIEVVQAVLAGEIPRESGIAILTTAFPVDKTRAAELLGPVDFKPTKPDPAPVPPGLQGGPPAAVPPGPPKPGEPPPGATP